MGDMEFSALQSFDKIIEKLEKNVIVAACHDSRAARVNTQY